MNDRIAPVIFARQSREIVVAVPRRNDLWLGGVIWSRRHKRILQNSSGCDEENQSIVGDDVRRLSLSAPPQVASNRAGAFERLRTAQSESPHVVSYNTRIEACGSVRS